MEIFRFYLHLFMVRILKKKAPARRRGLVIELKRNTFYGATTYHTFPIPWPLVSPVALSPMK